MTPVTEVPRYTRTAIVLHWIVAFLMLVNVVLAWSFDYVGESRVRTVIDLHKSIGITVLGLALLRILWRYAHRPPPLPAGYAGWERVASHAAHAGLYLLMLALPLSGWLHDSAWKDAATHPMTLYQVVPWPRIGWVLNAPPATREQLHDLFGAVHGWLAWVLYGLFVAHVAGALKHQFIDREPELQRMGVGGRR